MSSLIFLLVSGLCLSLREGDFFGGILACLVIFGFFGMGVFPLVLELSVEVGLSWPVVCCTYVSHATVQNMDTTTLYIKSH
jgi:hypothetical protein